jgi:CubicO group peptidase (beta-lactamase class C family)
VHPEYAMYLSTRDMARLGLLMLRDGKWKDKQLMPRNWASFLTTLYTPSSQVGPKSLRTEVGSGPTRWGYGALWWGWDEPRASNPSDWTALTGAFSAMGTDGQFITVLPALDMVVAHMNYTIMEPPEKAVSEFEYQTILQMIIDAHCGVRCWATTTHGRGTVDGQPRRSGSRPRHLCAIRRTSFETPCSTATRGDASPAVNQKCVPRRRV